MWEGIGENLTQRKLKQQHAYRYFKKRRANSNLFIRIRGNIAKRKAPQTPPSPPAEADRKRNYITFYGKFDFDF